MPSGDRRSADGASTIEEDDRTLRVLPLTGIPEICPGDDLPLILGEALARMRDAAPLREDDVLVVTQKIVSKAERAIVDLETVIPRPEALAFATRWDRDPRQVEVVLREATCRGGVVGEFDSPAPSSPWAG